MNKISINQEECIGCGLCADYAPDLFKLDGKDFKAKLSGASGDLVSEISIELSAEQEEQAKRAAEDCPVHVIDITEI